LVKLLLTAASFGNGFIFDSPMTAFFCHWAKALDKANDARRLYRRTTSTAEAAENLVRSTRKLDDIPALAKTGGKASRRVAALRNAPGAVVGGQNISRVTATGTWFRGTHGSFAKVPGQVADALRGRRFNSFNDFRSAFWKATANDADLAAHFSKPNITRMKKGLAPIAAKAQHHGEIRSFILHHRTPIHAGGGVYDLDNLLIVSPKYHQSILDPAFHFGR